MAGGAVVAEREFGVRDPNVLSAIRCHTTGKVGMLPLDMIVYLADKIEPSRRSYPALEKVRELAQSDLVAAMHSEGKVFSTEYVEEGTLLEAVLPVAFYNKLESFLADR